MLLLHCSKLCFLLLLIVSLLYFSVLSPVILIHCVLQQCMHFFPLDMQILFFLLNTSLNYFLSNN